MSGPPQPAAAPEVKTAKATLDGLNHYAIAKHNVNAEQLTTIVDDWMAFVNPDGFRGNACYQGGCESKASRGGCGGMEEAKLAV